MKDEMILKIEELTIGFLRLGKMNPVVDHISFSLKEGEILGIVGESGSGKTMSALAVMGLLPKAAHIISGKIDFMGKMLLDATENELRELKGSSMAMIFQEPMTSFNPILTIGAQVEEMLRLHTKCDNKEYRNRTITALLEAGLPGAESVYGKYPHQLSGGMRQRAMIAMAMIAGPRLLIADEPTTALDVTIQDKILRLLKKINQTHGTSIILISHDLGVIKSICNRALVMKDGHIEEEGPAKELFLNPQTTYTKELIAAVPVTWRIKSGQFSDDQKQKSHRNSEKSIGINTSENLDVNSLESEDKVSEENLLRVTELNVFYQERTKGIFSKKLHHQVVKDATFTIKKGESLGIVGESGCGKSSLAKAIVGLNKDIQGTITILSSRNKNNQSSAIRPQMVFQDPYGSLNPVKKIGWIMEEPLKIKGGFTKEERKNKVLEVISQVGLKEKHLERYVSQLSGGQRQRIAIAVALILNPELIILDEPVSSLDVTVQAQILKLLKELQQKYHLSYLFISHDLNVIYQVCDRVCVMYQGEIVETRNTKELFNDPIHEYSKVLLEAALPE